MQFEKTLTQDLFGPTKKYNVPSYQRGYAWKDKIQINDFWEDLQQVDATNPLYFGTLILQEPGVDIDSNTFDIVDGQQRITTLAIFFIVCRNHAIRNSLPQASTLPAFVAIQDAAYGGPLEAKLTAGKNITEAFDYLVKHEDYKGGVFPGNIDNRKARILKANYNYFNDRISSLDTKSLGDLVGKVLKNSFFLVVTVNGAMQAFDIFERTNARGVPLNIGDLLKNLLFSNETEIDNLTERWDKIVIDSDIKLPRLLKYFDALSNGRDTGKQVLFSHLRATVKKNEPSIFMNNIETFSNFYHKVINDDFKNSKDFRISKTNDFDFLYKDEIFFNRVKRSLSSLNLSKVQVPIPAIYSGLLTLSKFSEVNNKKFTELKSEYIKTVNIIECFHFVNNAICTTPTNTSEQLYASEAKKMQEATTIAEAKESLKRIRDGLEKIGLSDKETFVENFSQITYAPASNKPLIAYIFDRFENLPFEKTPHVAIFDPQLDTVINRTYEVEHISSISKWEGDEETLNSIGNLVLITHSTNRLVENFDLEKKLTIYKKKKFDNLSTLRDFVEWVEKNKYKELDEDAINTRAKKLAIKAYEEIWKVW